MQSKTGQFPTPGSLDCWKELYYEVVILEGKKHVSNLLASGSCTDVFMDSITSYLLLFVMLYPFLFDHAKKRSRLCFLFPPLFQCTWEYDVIHIFHGSRKLIILTLSPWLSSRITYTGTDSSPVLWGPQRPASSVASGVHISIPLQSSKADFISIQVLGTYWVLLTARIQIRSVAAAWKIEGKVISFFLYDSVLLL